MLKKRTVDSPELCSGWQSNGAHLTAMSEFTCRNAEEENCWIYLNCGLGDNKNGAYVTATSYPSTVRWSVWPTVTSLQTILYSNKWQLEKKQPNSCTRLDYWCDTWVTRRKKYYLNTSFNFSTLSEGCPELAIFSGARKASAYAKGPAFTCNWDRGEPVKVHNAVPRLVKFLFSCRAYQIHHTGTVNISQVLIHSRTSWKQNCFFLCKNVY